jgi:tetratricopeptide (TPR) repeat protein
MEQGEQSLENGNPDAAREQLDEALDDLEQAERELAQDQQQAEENLAREQMEKLADNLKAFIERQDAMIAETERLRLDKLGKWPRKLGQTRSALAETQRNLAAETRLAADAIDAVEVVGLALRGAARFMEQAADRIGEGRDVSPATVAIQSLAKKRFADLLEALESGKEDENANPENPPQDQAGGPQQAGPDGEMITLIAQLKIIRSLQIDLIDRVESIRSRTGNDELKLTDEDVNELASIAEEQEQLADLVRELTSYFGDPDIPPDAAGGEPDALDKEPVEPALPVN